MPTILNSTHVPQSPSVFGQPCPVQRIRKTFRAKSTVPECRDLARKAVVFLQRVTSNADTLYELELIITEACTNVVVHGYNHDHDGDIKVQLSVNEKVRVLIKIIDQGKPFTGSQPGAFELDPAMESGRGLYIISQLSDSHSYVRHDDQNILRIKKVLEKV
jgi:anti-sigma regulatory factor (Ser/Thr protein kinase)